MLLSYSLFTLYSVFVSICLFLLKTIATALVTSRLDYCKSFFQNIVFKDITKLQSVQNCLALGLWLGLRILLFICCFWNLCLATNVWHHIIFKIYAIVYQAPSCKQPSHLHSLFTPVRKPVQPWSSYQRVVLIYSVPKVNTYILGLGHFL